MSSGANKIFLGQSTCRLWVHCLVLYIISCAACTLLYFVRTQFYDPDCLALTFFWIWRVLGNSQLISENVFVFYRSTRELLKWGRFILLVHLLILATSLCLFVVFQNQLKNHWAKLLGTSSQDIMVRATYHIKWFSGLEKSRNLWWAILLHATTVWTLECRFYLKGLGVLLHHVQQYFTLIVLWHVEMIMHAYLNTLHFLSSICIRWTCNAPKVEVNS